MEEEKRHVLHHIDLADPESSRCLLIGKVNFKFPVTRAGSGDDSVGHEYDLTDDASASQ